MRSDYRTQGFTLIEAVSGVAVLTTLGAGLAVGVGGADKIRGEADSAFRHRQLGQAQHVYMMDHMGDYAGVNTSGAPYQAKGLNLDTGLVETADLLLGNTSSSTPTQTFDWISPIMGDAIDLGANRAQRMATIFNKLGDPRATIRVANFFGTVDDAQDFIDRQFVPGYRQVSFLQPAGFHLYSSRGTTPEAPTDLLGEDVLALPASLKGEHPNAAALVPIDFAPNIVNVGTSLASKVMHADGTRYLTVTDGLDFDINTNPHVNGAFMDSGPIVHESVAYGRAFIAAPTNVELSFRGRDGSMLVTMFDGSVRSMSREQAWTDPTPWYPSGSAFTGTGATPESIGFAAKHFVPAKDGSGLLIP